MGSKAVKLEVVGLETVAAVPSEAAEVAAHKAMLVARASCAPTATLRAAWTEEGVEWSVRKWVFDFEVATERPP